MNGYLYRDSVPEFNVVLDSEKLLEANRRHDAAVHTVSMDRKARYQCVKPERYDGFDIRRARHS